MRIAATRSLGIYSALAVASTVVGFVTNWRLSLALLFVIVLAALVQAMVVRSPRWWLFWLGVRYGSSKGLRGMAKRWAVALDPPSEDERYAWNSRPKVGEGNFGPPLVVPARLANRHKVWPNWAFNIRILRNGVEVSAEATGPVVTIRLSPDDFAVYNNDGKRWLRAHHREGENYDRRMSLEHEFAEALREAEGRRDQWSTVVAKDFPLRWASGGCLAIVEIEGDEWVALFFRDILPIGWNVGNGGSESLDEHSDVTSLLRRELGGAHRSRERPGRSLWSSASGRACEKPPVGRRRA